MKRKPFGFSFDGDRYTPQQVRLEVSKDEAQWQLAGKTAKTEHLAPELPDKKQEAVCVLFSRE